MTRSGRSVRDHDWCVWMYVDGYTTESNLYLQQKSLNRSLLMAIAYPFLLLR